jgi:site-specific recombinase XerD
MGSSTDSRRVKQRTYRHTFASLLIVHGLDVVCVPRHLR